MEKLNIPKTIHVGYRRRDDTYSGMLGFVIYTDEKGNKRKLVGCDGWRDHSIEMTDHVNEPTSGFVLNKGVGGARHSWGHNVRNEYIRVFDPRGFEFEISVANLLFILQECTSTKGKGLEGEFVYSWDGKELVLLPVGCHEYNQSAVFTAAKSLKVTKNDMQEGCVYMHKNMHQMVYLGKHNIRDVTKHDYYGKFRTSLYEAPIKTMHAFYDLQEHQYHFERGYTNIAQRDTEAQYATFADLYSDLVNGPYISRIDRVELVPVTPLEQDISKWRYDNILIQTEVDKYHIQNVAEYVGSGWSGYSTTELYVNLQDLQKPTFDKLDSNKQLGRCCFRDLLDSKYQQKLFTIQYVLKSGQKIGVYGYVKP